jgi:hypothetical protein
LTNRSKDKYYQDYAKTFASKSDLRKIKEVDLPSLTDVIANAPDKGAAWQ